MRNQIYKKIKIGDSYYIYKNVFKNNPNLNLFTYRCSAHSCRITINIDKINLNKIKRNNNSEQIFYTQKKDHKCTKIYNNKSVKGESCGADNEIISQAKNIILQNPLKSVFFSTN